MPCKAATPRGASLLAPVGLGEADLLVASARPDPFGLSGANHETRFVELPDTIAETNTNGIIQ